MWSDNIFWDAAVVVQNLTTFCTNLGAFWMIIINWSVVFKSYTVHAYIIRNSITKIIKVYTEHLISMLGSMSSMTNNYVMCRISTQYIVIFAYKN